jgi:predicted dehydrogenase
VVTQMGNQGHSYDGTRRIVELIGAGVIGPVREVHVWTDRPQRYWAQGIPRPGSGKPRPRASQAATMEGGGPAAPPPPRRWSMRTVDDALLAAMSDDPTSPPPGLDWQLFLGAARDVPYHPAYHPFSWRGWVDFGVSAIGDMGAHLVDQPFWALGLGYPTSIVSTSTPWGSPASNPGSYPLAMTTQYEFPARDGQPPVRLTWYDGGLAPLVAPEIPRPGGDGGGGIFIGEKGYITYETYGNNPKVYPETLAGAAAAVPKKLPRVEVPHEINWARACKGVGEASAPFDYSARLTETMLLGIVALRAGQGRRLLYDGAEMRVTNVPEANAYLTREYRVGWEL